MMLAGNIRADSAPAGTRGWASKGLFTPIYQTANKDDAAILYGAIPRFMAYVGVEPVAPSGPTGVLEPASATGGPANAVIVVGLTVLHSLKDGRL